jgi:hypothetical protein
MKNEERRSEKPRQQQQRSRTTTQRICSLNSSLNRNQGSPPRDGRGEADGIELTHR